MLPILCRGLVLLMHGLNEHRFVILYDLYFPSHFDVLPCKKNFIVNDRKPSFV